MIQDHARTAEAGAAVDWRPLYRLGAVVAGVLVLLILAEFVVFAVWPPPSAGGALAWFKVFEQSALRGMLGFELLMIVYTLVSLPMILALYVALRRVDPTLMAIYLVVSLVGIVAFVAARPVVEMLSLSQQYAAATSEAQRAALLAAGEGMLATFDGTAFHVSYLFGSLGGLILSAVMWRSGVFGRPTACVRLTASLFDFGLYLPTVGLYVSLFGVFFLLAWDAMVARRLWQLARE